MANRPPYPDTDSGPERESSTGTPRWAKVFGIITLALVLLVVVIVASGVGGDHGPGRHMPSGGAGGHTPPSSVTAHSVQQP